MQDKPLTGKKVAIMVANGFDEIEFVEPQKKLIEAGATVKVISRASGLVNGWYGGSWGHFFPVDGDLADTLAVDYDGLVVPGGSRSVDKLAEDPHAKRILKAFMRAAMPVALLGEASGLLVAIEHAKARTLTGAAETRAALEAAGASWEDGPAVVEGNLATASAEGVSETVATFIGLVAAYESDVTQAA